jgi:hypothetical protein
MGVGPAGACEGASLAQAASISIAGKLIQNLHISPNLADSKRKVERESKFIAPQGTFTEIYRLRPGYRDYLLRSRHRRKGLEMYIDLVGLLTLLLVIWALIGILQSGAQPLEKLIWVIVIILLPILGFVVWYVMGPGDKSFPLPR